MINDKLLNSVQMLIVFLIVLRNVLRECPRVIEIIAGVPSTTSLRRDEFQLQMSRQRWMPKQRQMNH